MTVYDFSVVCYFASFRYSCLFYSLNIGNKCDFSFFHCSLPWVLALVVSVFPLLSKVLQILVSDIVQIYQNKKYWPVPTEKAHLQSMESLNWQPPGFTGFTMPERQSSCVRILFCAFHCFWNNDNQLFVLHVNFDGVFPNTCKQMMYRQCNSEVLVTFYCFL